VVALEWFNKFLPTWTPGHSVTIKSRLERDVFPWIGQQPIREITSPDVLRVLRRVESMGAIETAHRIKAICGQVFRYAVATGRADRDPSADLKGALPHYNSARKKSSLSDAKLEIVFPPHGLMCHKNLTCDK